MDIFTNQKSFYFSPFSAENCNKFVVTKDLYSDQAHKAWNQYYFKKNQPVVFKLGDSLVPQRMTSTTCLIKCPRIWHQKEGQMKQDRRCEQSTVRLAAHRQPTLLTSGWNMDRFTTWHDMSDTQATRKSEEEGDGKHEWLKNVLQKNINFLFAQNGICIALDKS